MSSSFWNKKVRIVAVAHISIVSALLLPCRHDGGASVRVREDLFAEISWRDYKLSIARCPLFALHEREREVCLFVEIT